MRMPEVLSSLVDEGIIEEVLRPLMSGKEAQIFLVEAGGNQYVAKVYKEANNRTFKHRADYTEGRKVRNSRDQRAIDKRTKHGRAQDEEAWRSTEVDMIYRLRGAGVRVPAPYQYIDGVLIMELVRDPQGQPAPRLGDVHLTPERAQAVYEQLIRETVRMLCAGVVHGDLSDFNVLLAADGPVIIDFPQSVDPAKNPNARKLLMRDVDNLHRFVARFAPNMRRMPYAEEMWALYESNQLTPETVLRGQYRPSQRKADTRAVLELIGEANRDEQRRRNGAAPAAASASQRPRRVEVIVDKSMLPRASTRPLRGRSSLEAAHSPTADSRGAARSGTAGVKAVARGTPPEFRSAARFSTSNSARGPAPESRGGARSPGPNAGRRAATDPTRTGHSESASHREAPRQLRGGFSGPQRPNVRTPFEHPAHPIEQRRLGAVDRGSPRAERPRRNDADGARGPSQGRPDRFDRDTALRSNANARLPQAPSSPTPSHERRTASPAADGARRRYKP